MFSILLLFARIAAALGIAPTIANVVTAMMMTQASEDSVIDAATKRNSRLFAAYIVVLLLTALIITVFTWLTWDSGNKVQDTIRHDADARIQEAKQGIEKLKNDNLTLASQLTKLQDEAAKQQERAAVAERSLLELRQRLADRIIDPEQRGRMLAVLRMHPPGQIVVQSLVSGGREALQYGAAIASVFRAASWTTTDPNGLGSFTHPIAGVFLVASPDMDSNDSLEVVIQTLIAGNIASSPVTISPETRRGTGVLEIWVASK